MHKHYRTKYSHNNLPIDTAYVKCNETWYYCDDTSFNIVTDPLHVVVSLNNKSICLLYFCAIL